MPSFSRESLEMLRSRMDLVEVLSPYIKLQRVGAAHKALCPFHEERSPSFVIQKGDSHYHCYGCGAHGDAIQFLMAHLKMSFIEAVEFLAERFQVSLEESSTPLKPKGPPRALLKEALEKACLFYEFFLLHTKEGHSALEYLYRRGMPLDFIRIFRIGLAPRPASLFRNCLQDQNISEFLLKEVGLLKANGQEFFSDRITIPIFDSMNGVIGFSARKFRPDGFGPKYINTPETSLFKKSRVLFGLSHSRKQMTKERKALIVEGQIDALRLIYHGFNWTIAGQGTAFSEEQVKEVIHLGVRQVYLALDGDRAGREAAAKIGHLFQKEGIEVWIVLLQEGEDPDMILQQKGPEEWKKRVDQKIDYLRFRVDLLSESINIQTPAGKNEIVQTIAQQIRDWDHPLMVHESLRRLAHLTQVPDSMVSSKEEFSSQIPMKRSGNLSFAQIDPDRILEADLLRWLIVGGEELPRLLTIARKNLEEHHFRLPAAWVLYQKLLIAIEEGRSSDLLSLAIALEGPEQQIFLAEILQKKVNRGKVTEGFVEALQRVLDRHWMQKREEIKLQIYSGHCDENEVLELARQFDTVRRDRPQVILPEELVSSSTD